MRTVYKNANDGMLDVIVENGKITFVGKTEETGIDLRGEAIYPGLIDIHSHGCLGYDTMDQDKLYEMSVFEAKNGITSWLPTTMTMDMNTIRKVVNPPLPNFPDGANVLGFHMEGPYVSPDYKGAQNADYIKAPSLEEWATLKNIKVVTIAPELNGSMEFIQACDAVVSLGHTGADYEMAMKAITSGAASLTHTFNAMPPLHHRNPGPIGAAIASNLYVEVICDGLHIHPSVILGLYHIFGPERMILISDSMRATGMPDGQYEFGGQEITVKNKVARTQEGAIAGSTSTLFDCVKQAIAFGIPKEDAFRMASATPAALCGFTSKGQLAPGYDADFITLDKDLNLTGVYIADQKII